MLRHSRMREQRRQSHVFPHCEHTVTGSLSQVMKAGTLSRTLAHPGEFRTPLPSDVRSHAGTARHASHSKTLQRSGCRHVPSLEKKHPNICLRSSVLLDVADGRVSTVLITGLAVSEDQLFLFFPPFCCFPR